MNLRWYIKERELRHWDDRWDVEEVSHIQSNPVLQYEIGNNNWITVPTIIERINNDGRSESSTG